MKKIYGTMLFLLCMSMCSFGQWTSLGSPTSGQLSGVAFTSADTGYLGGVDGEIFKTLDGGNTWNPQNSGITENIFALHFTNASSGYACASSGSGIILKTSDGGQSWNAQNIPNATYLLDIFFPNDSVGFCVGYNGMILKTDNRGLTWNAQNSGTSQNLRGVHFIDENSGYVVAEFNVILKTTDGGATWNAYPSGTNSVLLSLFFVDENVGYAVGGFGAMVKTINGGVTWLSQSSSTNDFLQSIYFINAFAGFAVGGNGVIVSTTNSGETWSSEYAGNFTGDYGWYGLAFFENSGYAVGFGGNIVKNSSIPVGLNEQEVSRNVTVYPNPTNGPIHVLLDRYSENTELIIRDSTGKVVDQKRYAANEKITLNIAGQNGLYSVEVASASTHAQIWVVKQQ